MAASNRKKSEKSEQKESKKPETDTQKRGFQPWLGEERPAKRLELDLDKYIGRTVEVLMTGNKTYRGTLQGHDLGMNLVLHDTCEIVQSESLRNYGTVVVRGPLIQSLAPVSV